MDERSLDLRRASELSKIITSHEWILAHFDDFGDSGVVVRYSCRKCNKEWTTFLLDPEGVKKLQPTAVLCSAVILSRDGLQSVPFELLEEAWNEYLFSDNVVVRLRLILTAVMQQFELGPMTFETKTVVAVSAPESLRGRPGEIEQDANPSVPKWECPILVRQEKWNEYFLADGGQVVKIIFVANKAFRLENTFDKYGQPVYYMDGKTLIKIRGIAE